MFVCVCARVCMCTCVRVCGGGEVGKGGNIALSPFGRATGPYLLNEYIYWSRNRLKSRDNLLFLLNNLLIAFSMV